MFSFSLFNMYGYFACMYISTTTCMPDTLGGKKTVLEPLVLKDGCKPPCECWELYPDPLERTTSALNYRAHVYIKKKKKLERDWRDASATTITFSQRTCVGFTAPVPEARHQNSSFRDSVLSSSLWRYYTHTCTNPQALTCVKLKIKIKSFF